MKVEPVAAVEVIEQDDVREVIEVHKPRLEILEHLGSDLYTGGTRWLNRHAFELPERGMNDSNWPVFDLHLFTCRF